MTIRPIPPSRANSPEPAEHKPLTPELRSRLESPRIILWASPSYSPEQPLLGDLPRLGPRLLAIYSETEASTTALTSALGGIRARQTVTLASPRDLEAWKSDDLSIVALPPRDIGDSRTRRIREKLLDHTLKQYLGERPFVVGLGLDASDEDLRAFLEVIGDYDDATPVVLLGDPEALSQALDRVTVDHRPHVVTGWPSWEAFRLATEAARYSLLTVEGPLVLVGEARVPLADVFEDPSLRLDGTWRLVTTRAAAPPPPGTDIRDLFRAFMDLNERRDARSADEDCLEWWAYLENIPLARPVAQQHTRAVLTELAGLKSSENKRPRVCWLPAEAGAGATAILHAIALEVARQGYPVLVLRQEARDADAEQVKEYLNSLRALSRGGGEDEPDGREHPALLVLDAQHAGLEHVEMLPDYLVRRHAFRVLTLWACNVAPGSDTIPHWVTPWDWFSDRLVGLKDLRPKKDDIFLLPALPASASSTELTSLRDHVEALKTARHLDLPERTAATWEEFQRRQGFEVDALLRATDLEATDKAAVRHEFEAESLFWILLYHFLTNREADPVRAALRTRVDSILAGSFGVTEADLVFSLLVEIAKASAWGLVVPESALVDWHSRPQEGTATAVDTAAGVGTISAAEAATRLKAWARGAGFGEAIDPAAPVRRALDRLEEKGWIRRHTIGRSVMVRFPHRTLARIFLLVALEQHPEKVTTQDARAIMLMEWAFEGFQQSLAALRPTDANIHYCEQLSEAILVGDDLWEGWRDDRGSARLAVYRRMPAQVRERSRVLMHHYAMVLRRSTFRRDIDPAEKRKRLGEAHEQLRRALEMPWRRGVRDEHPAFIRTTLGLVFNSLSLAATDRRESLEWLDQAKGALREALIDLPASRHTRLALAQVLLEEVRQSGHGPQAAGPMAEALQLVSVEPTGNEKRWYQTRADLAGFFSEDARKQLIQDLKRRGVEDGYLLEAELCLVPSADPWTLDQSRREALQILRQALAGEEVVKRPRVARRAAELMSHLEDESLLHEDRYRLLTLAESRTQLTAMEEFQLAWLAFVLGRYGDGMKRFDGLRASQRAYEIDLSAEAWLVPSGGREPRKLQGEVERVEGDRGWMVVRDEAAVRLFRAPFVARHFSRSGTVPRHGQTEPVLIRFTGMGPRAVPLRFGFDQRGRLAIGRPHGSRTS